MALFTTDLKISHCNIKQFMESNIDNNIFLFCKDPYIEDDENGNIKYVGDFNQKDLYEGFGIYYNEIGNKIYEGYWMNGLMEGKGIFYYKGVVLQKGEWKNGKKHGYGIRYQKGTNIIEYEGEWNEGEPCGESKTSLKKTVNPSCSKSI